MSIQVVMRDINGNQRGCFVSDNYEHVWSVLTDYTTQHPEEAETLVVVIYPNKEA